MGKKYWFGMGLKGSKKSTTKVSQSANDKSIQYLAPIRMVIDFDKAKNFEDLIVGDTFFYYGRIYRKTMTKTARLVFSSEYFRQMYLRPQDRRPADTHLNMDMVGELYRFNEKARCHPAVAEFRPLPISTVVGAIDSRFNTSISSSVTHSKPATTYHPPVSNPAPTTSIK